MTKIPSLPELCAHAANSEYVLLVPKTPIPIELFDFIGHVDSLVARFDLKKNFKGCGHSVHIEAALKDGLTGEATERDNKYHSYYAYFDQEIPAKRFLIAINQDSTLLYRAELPQTKLGLAAYAPVKRLSKDQ